MANGGSNTNSLVNMGSSSLSQLKEAANPSGAPVVKNTVSSHSGFLDEKSIDPPQNVSADYYRRGFRKSPEDDADLPDFVQPRSIDPYAEEVNGEASIRVYGYDGQKERDFIPPYTKFVLESVNEGHSERSQIVETFGDFYVFFFGERPPMYSFSGTLINTRNVNWVQDWMYMYEKFLRGTSCVEYNARVIITYGGRQIEGFMMSTGSQTNAITQEGSPFQFNVVVTSRKTLGLSDDFGIVRVGENGQYQKLDDIQALLDTIAGPEGKGTSSTAASAADNAAKKAMDGDPSKGACFGGVDCPGVFSNKEISA